MHDWLDPELLKDVAVFVAFFGGWWVLVRLVAHVLVVMQYGC